MKNWLTALAVLIGFFVTGAVCFLLGMQKGDISIMTVDRFHSASAKNSNAEDKEQVPRFIGYVRGRSQTTLRNKYAGFVSKVRIYSHTKVKKGDVIIEYDDLPWRTSMKKLENSIIEQQKTLDRKKLNLVMIRINPLPSEYRNLYWKRKIAQENLDRSKHEFSVYQRLHGSKIVTDLALREKQETYNNSLAEVKKMDNDMKILHKGLADYYVKSAELEVQEAETRLNDLKAEWGLLKEEQKYYKIVAPYDGVCITNSDTVHAYNAAGTEAVEVHRVDRKLVYSYCPERYIGRVREGKTYRFLSNQYPDDQQGFELRCFEIKKARYMYGDESYYLVKLRVMKEPHPLRIGSIGTLEIIPDKPQQETENKQK